MQLDALLGLGAATPDNGRLTPWRFVVVVPRGKLHRLAEAFALSLVVRGPGATLEQIEAARGKAHRAPLLVHIARLGRREPDIPALERFVSLGAAAQNILLGAHAMGFGAGLTSGQGMSSPYLRALCNLRDGEVAVCCINLGTVSKHKVGARVRPLPPEFTTVLGGTLQTRAD